LRQAIGAKTFDLLKTKEALLKVQWIPNVEGKAELPEEITDKDILREGLEAKSKFETQKTKKGKKQTKPKRFFIIIGEWSADDKQNLRTQNPNAPAKGVVEKAIKDHEVKWEAKAQSRMPEKADGNDDADGHDDDQDGPN
jgi:hypothetical protein